MARPTILITGFGPFPATPFNASAGLVQAIERKAAERFLPYDLRCAILPTDWREAPALVGALVAELKPVAVVHFGVSSRATGFQIETVGYNAANGAADCSGRLPHGYHVRRSAPPRLAATLPVGQLAWQLRLAGLPVSLSSDAGRYLCNATLYHTLLVSAAFPDPPLAGFVHIPALKPEEFENPATAARACNGAMLERGVWIILATLARILRNNEGAARRVCPNQLMNSPALGGCGHDNRPSGISDGGRSCRRGRHVAGQRRRSGRGGFGRTERR
jgi:pyroglutamyl-peptidase